MIYLFAICFTYTGIAFNKNNIKITIAIILYFGILCWLNYFNSIAITNTSKLA